MTSHADIAIIGAGFAGLAAAERLAREGLRATVFEADAHWGGHTHSDVVGGFTFDEGPHVSFTKDPVVRELFARSAEGVREFQARLTNYSRGSLIEHPAQVNLSGLDPDLVTRCIVDLVEARARPIAVDSYEDWCRNTFGETFAREFPLVYTRKYWTVEARDMTTDWAEKRVYAPTLAEVVRGALQPALHGQFHYFSVVRYPESGGYQSFMRLLAKDRDIELDKRVVSVDIRNGRLHFADGTERTYGKLISTMPLPELVRAIPADQSNEGVRAAAEQLLCTSLALVDVAVNRSDLFSHHLLYVYDEDVSFARAHFPHMLAPGNAPAGQGSIQVEIYYSHKRPLPSAIDTLPDRVVGELVRIGILRSAGEVIWARSREVQYANVVFDHRRAAALGAILPWLEAQGVVLAGRYGEWGYHWTDDAVRSGWAAASRCIGVPA